MLEGVNLKILALINAEGNRNNNNFDSPDSHIWFAGLILMILFFSFYFQLNNFYDFSWFVKMGELI